MLPDGVDRLGLSFIKREAVRAADRFGGALGRCVRAGGRVALIEDLDERVGVRAGECVGQGVGSRGAVVGVDVEGGTAGVAERELVAVRGVSYLVEAVAQGRAVGRAEAAVDIPPSMS